MKKIKIVKKWYRFWSVWFLMLICISPDLYNAVSAMGWLEEAPKPFVWTIRILATIGLISRLIKQKTMEDNNGNTNNS